MFGKFSIYLGQFPLSHFFIQRNCKNFCEFLFYDWYKTKWNQSTKKAILQIHNIWNLQDNKILFSSEAESVELTRKLWLQKIPGTMIFGLTYMPKIILEKGMLYHLFERCGFELR